MFSVMNRQRERALLEQDLRTQLEAVNQSVEKHARIGAIIVSSEPWSIENGLLTPTLKLRREMIEERFGDRARELSRFAAEQGELLIEWEMPNEKHYGTLGGTR